MTTAVVPHPSGNEGRLVTPKGAELPVRTFEHGEDVVLVVLDDVDEQLRDEQLEPATLEYGSARGMVRMRGEAVFEQRSLVRFHARDAEIIQRREFVRVHTPQQVSLDGPPPGPVQARTIDLSGGGMLVSGAEALELGDAIRFTLGLGEDPLPVQGFARVVRIRHDGKRALHFEQISEADRQRLIRFVFGVLRTARAKTRGDYA